MASTYTVKGTMTGELWWPMGMPAFKEVSFSFAREGRAWVAEADTLAEGIEALMRAEDGDFSSAARLTADSYLEVTRERAHGRTVRWFPLTLFGSIAGYVDAETYSPDPYFLEDLEDE
jgi:hypothetical protein